MRLRRIHTTVNVIVETGARIVGLLTILAADWLVLLNLGRKEILHKILEMDSAEMADNVSLSNIGCSTIRMGTDIHSALGMLCLHMVIQMALLPVLGGTALHGTNVLEFS